MNFDIEAYLGGVRRLGDDDVDYQHFVDHPLDADALECLQYMHDVEFHTTCYLRDLLVTSAHDDPEVTSFLAMWAYEEFWHGEAIAKVLDAHDVASGRERVSLVRRRVGRERLRTLAFMAGSSITEHIATVALAWGAVNEWTTQAGYLRLATVADDPVLADLLRRIAKQEGRHIDFYASQAERRLAASPRARRWTRRALRHKWRPVGSTIVPRGAPERLIRILFAGSDGREMACRIDDRISRLPGLDGLGLVERVRSRALATDAA